MQTVLITGIHGFVGSSLVASLKSQHTIYGLDIVSPQKDGITQTFSWDELLNIPPVDCIIHLAGKAHDTKNKTDAQIYFDINTGLTQTIFDWFLTTKASKFIFFSSVKAAADQVQGDILTEDVVPAPKGPYGESKIAAEEYILSSQSQDLEPGTREQGAGNREQGSKEHGSKEHGSKEQGARSREQGSGLRSPVSGLRSSFF